jgi:hypothetical protein
MDIDRDGKIDKREFNMAARPDSVFKMLDADGDGKITRKEFIAGFNILDTDNDGYITKDEFNCASRAAFDLLDKDGDGMFQPPPKLNKETKYMSPGPGFMSPGPKFGGGSACEAVPEFASPAAAKTALKMSVDEEDARVAAEKNVWHIVNRKSWHNVAPEEKEEALQAALKASVEKGKAEKKNARKKKAKKPVVAAVAAPTATDARRKMIPECPDDAAAPETVSPDFAAPAAADAAAEAPEPNNKKAKKKKKAKEERAERKKAKKKRAEKPAAEATKPNKKEAKREAKKAEAEVAASPPAAAAAAEATKPTASGCFSAWLLLMILSFVAMAECWKHACILFLTQIAVPSPIAWAFNCRIAEIKAQNSVGARKKKAKKKDETRKQSAQARHEVAGLSLLREVSTCNVGKSLLLAGLVVLALEVAGCVWLEPYVKTGLVDWRVSSTAPPPAPNQTQDSGCLLVLLVLKAVGVWGVAFVVQQHQSAQAVERAVPDRKQVVMQKAVKRMQERGLPGAALTLFALCLSLLLSNARGAECTSGGSLPCSFGGCEFSKDANGVLDRTGSCPTQTGWLYLDRRGIKGLREGVFSNMGACG